MFPWKERRMFQMLKLFLQPDERVVRHHFPEAELIETCLRHTAPGSPRPSPVQSFLVHCWLEPILVPEGLLPASSCCSCIFRESSEPFLLLIEAAIYKANGRVVVGGAGNSFVKAIACGAASQTSRWRRGMGHRWMSGCLGCLAICCNAW